jgi:hypothetical protein
VAASGHVGVAGTIRDPTGLPQRASVISRMASAAAHRRVWMTMCGHSVVYGRAQRAKQPTSGGETGRVGRLGGG